jgi:hypothetical protein
MPWLFSIRPRRKTTEMRVLQVYVIYCVPFSLPDDRIGAVQVPVLRHASARPTVRGDPSRA